MIQKNCDSIMEKIACTTSDANRTKTNFIRGDTVYILGDFDETISSNVIPDFFDLINTMSFAKAPEINIVINSHGGYAHELFGLLSIIAIAKSRGIKINTYNIGVAYSCGSLLAVCGDKRYMYKYANNLPHLGEIGMISHTVEQLERGAKHAVDHFSTIASIYAEHTKIPKKELIKILKDDCYYMGAEECLKYGFCDEIIV